MDRNELMTIIGLVIGIPGFGLLFFQGNIVIGSLVLIICSALAWHYWALNQPEFTLLFVEKVVTIHDPQGHKATLWRKHVARANHKGMTEFWIRSISADGSIENILIDGKSPDTQIIECGDIAVCKRFRNRLKRGDKDEMTFSYDMTDSFTKNVEGTIHPVTYKTKKVRVTVKTPKERPIRSARASLRYGGQVFKDLPQPRMSSDGCEATIEVKRPKLGAEYYLEWEW